MISRGMLVLDFLFLAVLDELFPAVMALRQGVKCLDLAALIKPGTLAGDGALLGLCGHILGLGNSLIELDQEELIVVHGIATDAKLGRGDEALTILIAVLLQQNDPLVVLLRAGQKLYQFSPSLVHAQLGKIEQSLQ